MILSAEVPSIFKPSLLLVFADNFVKLSKVIDCASLADRTRSHTATEYNLSLPKLYALEL